MQGIDPIVSELFCFAMGVIEQIAGGRSNWSPYYARVVQPLGRGESMAQLIDIRLEADEGPAGRILRQQGDRPEQMDRLGPCAPARSRQPLSELDDLAGRVVERNIMGELLQGPALGGPAR
jgi:hypothetical protein